MKKSINITEEGRTALQKELAELISERPAISERIATARAFGDLSENEEYSSARAEQKRAETRILEIEDILKNAHIIQSSSSDKITIGTTVTVEANSKQQIFSIVGPVEANPLEGKISNESPIGKILLGRKVGESAELHTPKGTTIYKIIEIK